MDKMSSSYGVSTLTRNIGHMKFWTTKAPLNIWQDRHTLNHPIIYSESYRKLFRKNDSSAQIENVSMGASNRVVSAVPILAFLYPMVS